MEFLDRIDNVLDDEYYLAEIKCQNEHALLYGPAGRRVGGLNMYHWTK